MHVITLYNSRKIALHVSLCGRCAFVNRLMPPATGSFYYSLGGGALGAMIYSLRLSYNGIWKDYTLRTGSKVTTVEDKKRGNDASCYLLRMFLRPLTRALLIYPLPDRIGRCPKSDIFLNPSSTGISWIHTEIVAGEDALWIVDRSTNGTG